MSNPQAPLDSPRPAQAASPPRSPSPTSDDFDSPFSFRPIDYNSPEVVLSAHYNYYGTRLALGCADHRIRVYDRHATTGSFALTDTFRAHDGSVHCVRWKPGPATAVIGSIGQDLKLKIWGEDMRHAPNSGRRFRNIFAVSSGNEVMFVGLDFRVMDYECLLAAVTRDGLLSLFEPVKPEVYSDWKEVDQFWVTGESVPRGTESSFALCWQQCVGESVSLVKEGGMRGTVSCALASMDVVKLYRVSKEDGIYRFQSPFAELTIPGGNAKELLVRDVAWCPVSWLDYELVAMSSSDGYVRFFEVHTQVNSESEVTRTVAPRQQNKRGTASGITAGLAGVGLGNAAAARVSPESGNISREVILVDTVRHDGVWHIKWMPNSQTLVSSGGSVTLRIWKKAVDGHWKEFASSEMD
ncbi:epoxide hydrolase, soluble (sEH) [Agyrium rufum]|nr:epoxide hydrolase, soluble (sEH) [Agyrium rufum]